MDIKPVCKDVGWDGQSFCCLRCGRAGFTSEASARGHLSQCRGTLIQKGLVLPPPPAANFGGLYGGGAGAGAGGGGGGQIALQQQPLNQYGQPGGRWNEFDYRLGRLENEYNHLLVRNNTPKQESWLSQNFGWLVLGGIMLIALFSAFGQNQCPVPAGGAGSSPKRSGPDINKLSERILNKGVDTAITRGFGKLFK